MSEMEKNECKHKDYAIDQIALTRDQEYLRQMAQLAKLEEASARMRGLFIRADKGQGLVSSAWQAYKQGLQYPTSAPNLAMAQVYLTAAPKLCKFHGKRVPPGDFVPPRGSAMRINDREAGAKQALWDQQLDRAQGLAKLAVKRALREWPVCVQGGAVALAWEGWGGVCVWCCSCGK